MNWTHNKLAFDLADSLCAPNRLIWTDMQLGPAGSPRPDVLTMEKSFVKPLRTVYEVKVTVADLRGDIAAGKSLKYFDFASRVYFCYPAEMNVSKGEIPATFGVRVRGPDGWRTVRRAPVHEVRPLGEAVWIKLLIDGCKRERRNQSKYQVEEHRRISGAAKRLGDDFAAYLRDRDYAQRQLQELQAAVKWQSERRDAEKEAAIQDVRAAYSELSDILGIEDMSKWAIQLRVREIRSALLPDMVEKQLVGTIDTLQRQLDIARKAMCLDKRERA